MHQLVNKTSPFEVKDKIETTCQWSGQWTVAKPGDGFICKGTVITSVSNFTSVDSCLYIATQCFGNQVVDKTADEMSITDPSPLVTSGASMTRLDVGAAITYTCTAGMKLFSDERRTLMTSICSGEITATSLPPQLNFFDASGSSSLTSSEKCVAFKVSSYGNEAWNDDSNDLSSF